ncbi:MAG: lactate utilization protein [Treponema sp.]|nr:lactate utilization protein [Treponema sp.]
MADTKEICEKVVSALKKRKFDAYYVANSDEARKKALELIPQGSCVSWGGSVSIAECGLLDAVKSGDYVLIDRDKAKNPEEKAEIMRRGLTCDTFLTSFNAVSEDGVLLNIDGNGNRVSAIAFGAKSVVAIVGANKIVPSEADLEKRALSVAAPLNAKRLNVEKVENICAIFVKTRMSLVPGRIKIIVVGENLGY